MQKRLRAILIPEARFYSGFPESWKGKFDIKMRRANQLIRVFWRYLLLLVRGKVKISKGVVLQGILNYLFGPVLFLALVITTALLLPVFPYFALVFPVVLIPKIGTYFFEAIQNYVMLLLSIFSVAVNKRFVTWSKPKDRLMLNRELLLQYGLL
jgi:hypothetical protein